MKTFFIILILCSCSCSNTPTTTTTTTPSAEEDDPFILGEETLPPIGCRDWRTKEGKENADC